MKRIVLCADDYGQAPNISQAIINLIEQQRLSATSCLVTSAHWNEHSQWLKPYLEKIDVGLHFNLTEGLALSSAYRERYGHVFHPLRSVLRKAFLGQFDAGIIAAECQAQLDRFCEQLGKYPAYIDGHQHVHQFPTVRHALLKIYKTHSTHISYVRLPKVLGRQDALKDYFKVRVIQATGTRAFEKLLRANQIPHNTSFAGIYAFSPEISYGKLFAGFLESLENGGLLMCHPGYAASSADTVPRSQEYRYLASPEFEKDCKKHHIWVGRFVSAGNQS